MQPKNLKEVIKSEYKKCANDIVYFARKYVYIQNPVKGRTKFELYPFQENALRDFQEHNKNIILKARQMGISTLCATYILWLMVFHKDKYCLIISKTQEASKEVVTKIRFGNDNLPSWLRVPAIEDNRLSLRLSNGSQVKGVSSSKDAARGAAISFLMIDEAQFIEDASEIWVSAQPALSTGGKSVILSTPEGVGGFFHKTWCEAETGRNGFNTIKLKWSLHPERDETWKQKQLLELGPKKFAQEFDCEFGASGNTVIDNETIDKYEKMCIDPIEKRGEGANLWIFKRPQEGRKYGVIADVGRGDSEDFSAFHVLDLESMEQVVEFEHKLDTKAYGDVLINVSTEYNDALLVIENNNIGWATIQRVIDRGYKNLFYMTSDMRYVDIEDQTTNRYYAEEKKAVPGFTTTIKTRPLIITKLEEYFRLNGVKVNSKRLINQLRTFIWHNGKAEAAKGYNDDLCMSFALGMWVRDTALVVQNKRNEVTKQLLGGIKRIGGDSSGVGGIYTNSKLINNPWETKIGGVSEDLRWLIR